MVLVVLGLAQLVLPGIAEQRLRDRLSRYGTVRSVSVQAFPAIELLWHHADHVSVVLAAYRPPSSRVGGLLAGARDAGSIDVRAAEVDVGLLRLHDATLHTRGGSLTAEARIAEADLAAAVPFLQSVVPVASSSGALTLRGTASVLGVGVSADAVVGVSDGAVVVVPDVPFGALATVTVFSDPHVAVEAVSAAGVPGGFAVAARGRLR